jgi:hypothetical protein
MWKKSTLERIIIILFPPTEIGKINFDQQQLAVKCQGAQVGNFSDLKSSIIGSPS